MNESVLFKIDNILTQNVKYITIEEKPLWVDCIIKKHEMLIFVKKKVFFLRIVQTYFDQFVSAFRSR